MIKVYALLWLGLLALAFVNASIRELCYESLVSELSAHQISTLTGCLIMFVYALIVSRKWPIPGYSDSIRISIIWVSLTVFFETIMVLVFMKKDINFILESYNVFKGQLWPLFLIWLGLLPFILKSKNPDN